MSKTNMILQNSNRHWKLFWQFRKLSLMRLMEYRKDFFFWGTITLCWTAFNFFFISLVVGATGQIGGWSTQEIYLLVGVFTMLDGIQWSFMYENMREFTQRIFNGELSMLLLKPINTQWLIMNQKNSYNNVPRFFVGLGIVIYMLKQMNIQPRPMEIATFAGLFVSSVLFLYFFWFIVACLAFRVDRLDNINEIVPHLQQLWRIPRSAYLGVMALLFVSLFPVAFLTSLPAEALLGRISGGASLYFLGFTLGLFLFSRWFFKHSIKKYSGVGG